MTTNSAPQSAEIVKVGHPVLREGTRLVAPEMFGSPALNELIAVMRVTLDGKGLVWPRPKSACRYVSSSSKTLKIACNISAPSSGATGIAIRSRSKR